MRLLTHNVLSHNSKEGKGFPLTIKAEQVRVDADGSQSMMMPMEQQVSFLKGVLPTLSWPALVKSHVAPPATSTATHVSIIISNANQGAKEMGIPTLPEVLTEDLAQDPDFLVALYHILMNVHLVEGTLTCPLTGREFPVTNEIPNMILEEEECERVRY